MPRSIAQTVSRLKNSYTYSTLIGNKINLTSFEAGTDKDAVRQNKGLACQAQYPPNTRNITIRSFVSSSTRDQQTKMAYVDTPGDTLRLSDYDCIGFDLDNTICMYKITAMVTMEYETLSKYLVNEKGYDPEYLLQPVENHKGFMQKGLVLDFDRGNVLQIDHNGYVVKASHGTKFLTEQEIEAAYGKERQWSVAAELTKNMIEAWNGPISLKLRTLLDYFDMPASLIFARIVDSLDAKEGHPLEKYNIWLDIMEAMIDMFRREHFSENKGGYFPALKSNPHKYINKCSENVMNWMKTIKKEKFTFLITGSHVDFASFVASNCMDDDWKNLFDVVICFAKKPGFFTAMRPFLSLDGSTEGKPLTANELKPGNVYSQGNWQDLHTLLQEATGKQCPKCVYIGDNLIQDIYTPSKYTKCDTIAIVEELVTEGVGECNKTHKDYNLLASTKWGSYFSLDNNASTGNRSHSLWAEIIRQYSKMCVPSLDVLARHSLEHAFPTFVTEQNRQTGYYPRCPRGLQVQ